MLSLSRSLLLSALALGAAPAAALAQGGSTMAPCVPGQAEPMCHTWTGTVTRVADGDSYDIDLDEARGEARVRKSIAIRLTGVQAMELKVYRRTARQGDCWGVEAAERAESLIKAGGWKVRISAQNPSSASGTAEGGRSRLRRSISTQIGGQWVDVGSKLVEEGLALPFPAHPEDQWNGKYQELAQQAAQARRAMWSGAHCDPAPPANVRVWLNYDADSNDGGNLNDEFITVKNLDVSSSLNLGGW
ncbi:MAG TPA: thermonuclease family protein, partial [Capillimicrobium sp.]